MFSFKPDPERAKIVEAYSRVVWELRLYFYNHPVIVTSEDLRARTGIGHKRLKSIMMFGRMPTFQELVKLADALDLELTLKPKPTTEG